MKEKKINKSKLIIRVVCLAIIWISLQVLYFDVINTIAFIRTFEENNGAIFSTISFVYSIITLASLYWDLHKTTRGNPWDPFD